MARQTVLVCDPDGLTREVISAIVEEAGHSVIALDSGVAALHALTTTGITCAFLAIDLVDIPGHEVARRAREALPSRPRLIALTGSISRRDFLASRAAGFDLHLLKPIERDQILVALATLRVSRTAA